jgi:hypothetical protein
MSANRSVTATFTPAPKALTVTKSGDGTGSVSSGPAGIDCGSTCSASYAHGTSVTLTATAQLGSSFSGWSGDCSGTGACTVTMSAGRSATATFQAQPAKTLTVTRDGAGTGNVTSNPAGIDCGSACSFGFAYGTALTLTPSPGTGSGFTGWSGACSGMGSCTVSMIDARSVTATFETLPAKTLTVSATGSGRVFGSGINCGSGFTDCSVTVAHGTSLMLYRSPLVKAFTWGGACSGTDPGGSCALVMSQDRSVTGTFQPGSTLTGTVKTPSNDPVANAPVEVCSGPSTCTSVFSNGSGVYEATDLGAGDYTITADPPSGSLLRSGQAGPKTVSGVAGATFTQDVSLTPAPDPIPPGTTITSVSQTNGVPTLSWDQPVTLETDNCQHGTGTYTVTLGGSTVRSGAMVESATSLGHYSATFDSLYPNTGDGRVTIDIQCPNGSTPQVGFDVYIDPSGVVKDAHTGAGLAGATVTLLRFDDSDSQFHAVANGSSVMSPANRNDPDTTRADGSFGWDVVAGLYKVRAEKAGCQQAETDVLMIPPPVTNLDLRLDCRKTLSIATAGGGSGNVTSNPSGIDCASVCSAKFIDGTTVTLTAAASAGSSFTGWSGACSGTSICTLDMTADRSATATFQTDKMLTVAKTGTGAGSVSSSPSGIDCGSTCSRAFAHGTSVTLTAAASAGSSFTGWSGACSGTGTCTLTLDQDRSATANFTLVPKDLTVTRAGAGTGWVTSSPAAIDCGSTCSASFTHGTSVTLTPTAASGSTFAGWSGACSGTGTCTLTMDQNRSATATFAVTGKTLSVAKSGSGSGKVTSAPAGINCGSTCSTTFTAGTSVTLTATASSKSSFTGWSGACSGKGTCTLTMDQDRLAVATFETKGPPKPTKCHVPYLKGLTLSVAKRLLKYSGCTLGKVKKAPSRNVPKGRVLWQRWSGPSRTRPLGTPIHVVISSGPPNKRR